MTLGLERDTQGENPNWHSLITPEQAKSLRSVAEELLAECLQKLPEAQEGEKPRNWLMVIPQSESTSTLLRRDEHGLALFERSLKVAEISFQDPQFAKALGTSDELQYSSTYAMMLFSYSADHVRSLVRPGRSVMIGLNSNQGSLQLNFIDYQGANDLIVKTRDLIKNPETKIQTYLYTQA